jgi:tetratricopeptide (TPR) repeat protein
MTIVLLATLAIGIGNAADADREKAQALSNESLRLANSGDFRAALRLIEASVAADPGFAEAHFGRAIILQALRNDGEALGEYEKTIQLKPDFPPAHIRRAQLLLQAGRHDEALKSANASIKLDSTSAESFALRGAIRTAQLDIGGAFGDLTRAIELDGKFTQAYLWRGQLYELFGKRSEALDDYTALLRLEPNNTSAAAKVSALGDARKGGAKR